MSTKYEVIIYWSEDDNSFIAEVPELPGCAADGPTHAKALANAEVVIQEWMETAKQLSRPIPQARGRLAYAYCRLTLVAPDSLRSPVMPDVRPAE